jgi:serine/threonine protein phosphatase PrpC
VREVGPPAYATRIEEATHARGEDRLAVVRLPDRTIFVVADGAGGVVAGAAAAKAVCDAVVAQCSRVLPASWADWLSQVDRAMPHAGLAAAVVVEVADAGRVVGASAGDCEAWLFAEGLAIELTEGQVRKPLLGEGRAVPVGFNVAAAACVLVVATDGLWKYAGRFHIADVAAFRPLEDAAAALVDSVRLKSGAIQDDVAVAICEVGLKLGAR